MIGKRVFCRRLTPGARLPEYAHKGDAGLDLFASFGGDVAALVVAPGFHATVTTGWAFEIPDGYVGLVLPRSGLAKSGIVAACGVIDSSYRGEVRVTLYNHAGEQLEVRTGDKIAQLVVMPIPTIELVEMDSLSETDRGADGFGSTGAR